MCQFISISDECNFVKSKRQFKKKGHDKTHHLTRMSNKEAKKIEKLNKEEAQEEKNKNNILKKERKKVEKRKKVSRKIRKKKKMKTGPNEK